MFLDNNFGNNKYLAGKADEMRQNPNTPAMVKNGYDVTPLKVKAMLETIQRFSAIFDSCIEGNRKNVSLKELNGGARIYRLFNDVLPREIYKLETDEHELRREIACAIRNTHGVRIGLFTPDVAFETIVKKRISRLVEPALSCVDLVVNEVIKLVHKCADQINRYPLLKQEILRVVLDYLREMDVLCKERIKLLIDFELSYMNTRHEDFIGFPNIEAKTDHSVMKSKQAVENQIIKRGWLSLNWYKSAWFVLGTDNLSWFKNEEEKEKKYMLPLDGLMLKEVESSGFISKNTCKFALFYPNDKCIYKDYKTLELGTSSQSDAEAWKLSFLRTGVYTVDQQSKKLSYDENQIRSTSEISGDPLLQRQVETLRKLVESYMLIVTTNVKRMVPKVIVFTVINSTLEFVRNELISRICQTFFQIS